MKDAQHHNYNTGNMGLLLSTSILLRLWRLKLSHHASAVTDETALLELQSYSGFHDVACMKGAQHNKSGNRHLLLRTSIVTGPWGKQLSQFVSRLRRGGSTAEYTEQYRLCDWGCCMHKMAQHYNSNNMNLLLSASIIGSSTNRVLEVTAVPVCHAIRDGAVLLELQSTWPVIWEPRTDAPLVHADRLSRQEDSSEIFLAKFVFDQICQLPLAHGQSWGRPTLDCFAGNEAGQHQVDVSIASIIDQRQRLLMPCISPGQQMPRRLGTYLYCGCSLPLT